MDTYAGHLGPEDGFVKCKLAAIVGRRMQEDMTIGATTPQSYNRDRANRFPSCPYFKQCASFSFRPINKMVSFYRHILSSSCSWATHSPRETIQKADSLGEWV